MNSFFTLWCPTRGPSYRVLRPANTIANHVCAVKITQEFRWLGIPLIVISAHAVREPVHNNSWDPFSKKRRRPCFIWM